MKNNYDWLAITKFKQNLLTEATKVNVLMKKVFKKFVTIQHFAF